MVYLFYHKHAESLKQEVFDRIFRSFTSELQTEISKFKRKEDRNRKLIGRVLLTEAFKVLGINSRLNQILCSPHSRPYFNDEFDFNISHSASMVVCAFSKTHRVGIDVEKMIEVSLNDFKNHFTEIDWEFIVNSVQPHKTFYDLWTKRESFLKATGTGLSTELKNIDANWTVKKWGNKEWINTELMLDESYSCHLCVSDFLPEIILREINPGFISSIA